MRKPVPLILYSCIIVFFLLIIWRGVLKAASSSEKALTLDPTLYPYSVAVDSLHHRAYIASHALNSTTPLPVTIFDTLNDEIIGVLEASTLRALAVNGTTHRLYVGNNIQSISVFDTDTTNQIATISSLPSVPISIAVNESSNQVYSIANKSNMGVLSVIDGETGTIKSNLQISSNSVALAVNPLKNIIYVVSAGETPELDVIDGNSNSLIKTIQLTGNVNDLAVDTVLNKLYITGDSSTTITAINLNTNTILSAITIPGSIGCAHTLAVDSLYHKLYAVCHNGLTVIDTNSNSVLSQMPVTGALPATNSIIAQFFSRDEVLNKLYIPLENTHQIGVVDLSVPPKIDSVNSVQGVEGSKVNIPYSFSDGNSSFWTITCDFGDGTAIDQQTQITKGTLEHLYPGSGIYTAVITVTNAVGARSKINIPVKIQNISPTVGTITVSSKVIPVNTTVSFQSSFTDPGVNDSQKAFWNWGDGISSEGTITNEKIFGSHAYSLPGIYTVFLTVTDKDNASTTNVLQYITINDSSLHSVFGSGEITSPLGTDLAEPNITGKIKLGFYAKNLSGTNSTGSAQFNFQVGNIDFHSTSIDSLNLASQGIFIKGSGLVNKDGIYLFALTVLKENQDFIRLKIIDKSSNSVIFDTQMHDDDSAIPKIPLEDGSVLIAP